MLTFGVINRWFSGLLLIFVNIYKNCLHFLNIKLNHSFDSIGKIDE